MTPVVCFGDDSQHSTQRYESNQENRGQRPQAPTIHCVENGLKEKGTKTSYTFEFFEAVNFRQTSKAAAT